MSQFPANGLHHKIRTTTVQRVAGYHSSMQSAKVGEDKDETSEPGLSWGGGKEEREKNLQRDKTYVYSLEEEERAGKAK